jgi:hypothetical protein
VFSQVERLRGLRVQTEVSLAGTAPAEISRLAREDLLADWPLPFLQREARLLARFGFPEAGMDLDDLAAALGLDALLVVPAPGGDLSISGSLGVADADLAQVACAYDRLLVRQSHADPDLDSAACTTDVDACLARRTLIAGDAALLAGQWLRTFGSSPLASEGGLPCAGSSSTAMAAPTTLVPVLTFPAEHGLDFVRSLFLDGGWAAVDQAYATPPTSTEQILHPERYPKDAPRPPEFPDPAPALGEGWTTDDAGGLGEWRTRLVLEAYLDPEQAALAAEGWDGDRYVLLSRGEGQARALILHTRWDTVRDAHEFATAFRAYGESRFGPAKRSGTALTWSVPSGLLIVDVGNDQTLWIEAPDAQAAAALREATGFPLY